MTIFEFCHSILCDCGKILSIAHLLYVYIWTHMGTCTQKGNHIYDFKHTKLYFEMNYEELTRKFISCTRNLLICKDNFHFSASFCSAFSMRKNPFSYFLSINFQPASLQSVVLEQPVYTRTHALI